MLEYRSKFRVLGSLCVSLACVFACKSSSVDSETSDAIKYEPGDRQPSLGEGYNSLTQDLTGRKACVAGKEEALSSTKNEVNLKQSVETRKIMRELSGEVSGPAKLVFLQSAAGGFFRSFESTASSINIVYSTKIVVGGEQLAGASIDPETKALAPKDLLAQCGDHYVQQINRGGRLTINLIFDFASEQNRKRWQNILKLAGPWNDIASDIKKKMEAVQIDGTLTVKIEQIGGSPNEAALHAKTCSLSSPEDFDLCRAQVDEVINYAATTFPAKLKENPAILNYITVPLSNLGVAPTLPLDNKILKVRNELELMSRDFAYLKDMIDLAAEKGIPPSTVDADAIAFNMTLVRNSGLACYKYETTAAGIAWTMCLRQFGNLKNDLKPFFRKNVLVNKLSVPATDINGVPLVNKYDRPIKVTFAIDPNESWNYGSPQGSRFDGSDPENRRNPVSCRTCLKGDAAKGAMLLRIGSDLSLASRTSELEIQPGESVSFGINDERDMISDNRGSISVYWRCINCSAKHKELPTFTLKVPAVRPDGTTFRRRTTGTLTYSIESYGTWRNSASWRWTGPKGLSDRNCGRSCPAPEEPYQRLIMKKGDQYVGLDPFARVKVEEGESLIFLSNDDKGGYTDNQGEMEINIQCLDCKDDQD